MFTSNPKCPQSMLAVLACSYNSWDWKNWDGGNWNGWSWGWGHWGVGCGDKEC